VDDARLGQLAAPRPKDLFSILERTSAISPLLVVLTILPGVIAMPFNSIDERDAQWRMRSLAIATAPSLFEALAPDESAGDPSLKWQPPLASWMAAAAVKLPWPIGSRGLELAEYVFAAALVPAAYLLCSRILGARIGFVAAVLVTFHTTFLEQHRHATPHALAVVTALIAFWGFLGHMGRGGELVSLDLLYGGIALGLCLLAGGPLAFAVVAVLIVFVVVQWELPREARPGQRLRGRRGPSVWQALRSLGVMVATGFAAGGWWVLMMLYSYGTDFWSGWLWGGPVGPALEGSAERFFSLAFLLRLGHEFFTTARVLSGLTILGLWVIGRMLIRSGDAADRSNCRFLVAWMIGAGLAFVGALRLSMEGSLDFGMWRLFLMLACTACAALAIDEIARRRISLAVFAAVTIATLAVGYFLLGPADQERSRALWMFLGGLVVAGIAARLLAWFCEGSELRQRLMLFGLLAGYMVADATIGLSSVRMQDADYRSLVTFRKGLPTAIDPETCVLISDSDPPVRLQLALKSVWPNAQLTLVRDWDAALKSALEESQAPKNVVVVDWSKGNSRPANPTGAQWDADPVGNPQFFKQRQLRAYVLVWEQKPEPAEAPPAVSANEKPSGP
jgi:hypothetical protein